MSSATTTDWRDVDEDPDPAGDLGYETVDLDLIPTTAGGKPRVLVLPTDEEQLKDEAFMIVSENAVCGLETKL